MPLRLSPASSTSRTHPLARRVLPLGVVALAAGSTVITGSGGPAMQSVATAIPSPPTKALPAELDVAAPYVAPAHCLNGALPGVAAFAQLLNQHYGYHVYGISRTCDGDHGEGRAVDWMLDGTTADGLALGNAITRWLTAPDDQGRPGAMARRFGISYLIWNGQIWGVYNMSAGWRTYTGPNPHIDHIHFNFTWDGGYQQTSWWTGVALTANRYLGPTSNPIQIVQTQSLTTSGYPVLSRGSVGSDVQVAQRLVGADPDGEFGPLTESAVRTWQGRYGVSATGVMDEATWAKAVELGLVENRSGSTTPPTTTDSSSLAQYANTTLSRGSSGEAVAAVQRALGGLEADGQFGPLTEQAVRTYQGSQGIPVTGVVDAATWAALQGTAAPTTPPTSGGSGAASALQPYATMMLRRGSTGEAVAALQGALGGLTADGQFGPLTEQAVRSYQQSKGLSVTGVVDAAMWQSLMGTETSGSGESTPPTGGTATGTYASYSSTTLKRGSTGEAVVALQRALGGIEADGEFGPLTEAAVMSFQGSKGLPQTGVVDTATWNALGGSTTTTTTSTSAGGERSAWYSTTLRRGSTGEGVMVLQQALGGLTVDGGFGPLTEAAVKEFQADAGLPQTGVVDEATWRALDAR